MPETARMRPWLDRVAALSGIVAVGLIMDHISVATPDVDWAAPAGTIAASLADNRDTATIAGYLGLAAAIALLWFLGYLHSELRRAEGKGGRPALVALAGGVTAVALLLVDVSFTLAETVLASYDADTQVAKNYLLYHSEFGSGLVPGPGALVAASVLAGLRYGALPCRFSWFGGAIVLLMVPAALIASGLGFVLALLWISVASVALCERVGSTAGPARVATSLNAGVRPAL